MDFKLRESAISSVGFLLPLLWQEDECNCIAFSAKCFKTLLLVVPCRFVNRTQELENRGTHEPNIGYWGVLLKYVVHTNFD